MASAAGQQPKMLQRPAQQTTVEGKTLCTFRDGVESADRGGGSRGFGFIVGTKSSKVIGRKW